MSLSGIPVTPFHVVARNDLTILDEIDLVTPCEESAPHFSSGGETPYVFGDFAATPDYDLRHGQ